MIFSILRRIAPIMFVLFLSGCVASKRHAESGSLQTLDTKVIAETRPAAVPPPLTPPPPVTSPVAIPEVSVSTASSPDTVVEPIEQPEEKTIIRIGLLQTKTPVNVSATFGTLVYQATVGSKMLSAKEGSKLRIKLSSRKIIIGKHQFPHGVWFFPEDDQVLKVNGRRYRGKIWIRPNHKGKMDVIEELPIEEYLYGVVPREASASWPAEMLKAQAIISRTYLIANRGRYSSRGFDLSSDVSSQVYGGLESEKPETTSAVDKTRGQILLDEDNHPVETFFHAACGGRTEEPRYVWSRSSAVCPYLQSVEDSYCAINPHQHWVFTLTRESLRLKLRRAGYKMGTIQKIRIDHYTPSGRALIIDVSAGDHVFHIPANKFRLSVGADLMRSTWLTGISYAKKRFRFEGQGWGHGVGLCQWGAKGRAEAGQLYPEILSAYYPGTHLSHIP